METDQVVPHYTVTAGVVWDRSPSPQARVLIAQRRANDARGGLWEFPGGKQEPGESLQECLARELAEELGIEVEVQEPFITVEHSYPELHITLHAFHCHILRGQPRAIACADWRWVETADLSSYSFSAADEHIVTALRDTKEQEQSLAKTRSTPREHRQG